MQTNEISQTDNEFVQSADFNANIKAVFALNENLSADCEDCDCIEED